MKDKKELKKIDKEDLGFWIILGMLVFFIVLGVVIISVINANVICK